MVYFCNNGGQLLICNPNLKLYWRGRKGRRSWRSCTVKRLLVIWALGRQQLKYSNATTGRGGWMTWNIMLKIVVTTPVKLPYAPLQSMPIGEAFEMIAMDICGPFPVTEGGNKYILVAADYLTMAKSVGHSWTGGDNHCSKVGRA